jgi:hypothetical protein
VQESEPGQRWAGGGSYDDATGAWLEGAGLGWVGWQEEEDERSEQKGRHT